jgi:hypothetical protein
MKRLALILIVVLCSMSMYAQPEPRAAYSEIVGTSNAVNSKFTAEINFGQRVKFLTCNKLIDASTGKPIVFDSMIDALNYMAKQNWEFVQAYTITESNQTVYHYILKKPFNYCKLEEQREILSK